MKEKVRENVGWILNVCEFWQHFLSFLIIRKQQDFFYFHIMIRMELDIGCICLFLVFSSFIFYDIWGAYAQSNFRTIKATLASSYLSYVLYGEYFSRKNAGYVLCIFILWCDFHLQLCCYSNN